MSVLQRTLVCLLILTLGVICATPAYAGSFTEVSIRPDRTKAGIAPGDIYIEVNPATVGTEAKLVFELDSRWSAGTHYSTTAGEYTTTTVGIKAGVSPLPLTSSTATSISGHTLTFSINDLTVGTTYGFFITGGYTLNRSAAEYLTVVSTQTAGSGIIDQQNVWTQTTADDQIVITARVPTATSNLIATVTPDVVNTTNRQYTEIPFTLTYGTDAAVTGPLTVQASWGLGTPEGQTSAAQDILEYVVGSAGEAYGSTPPVIDTINRTITWSIANYPVNTPDQTVHFTLKTTANYTGDAKVVAPIYGQITAPAQSSISTATITYLYVNESTSQSTPTPTPTTVPTTATALAALGRGIFRSITLTSLSDKSALFSLRLNQNADVTIRYGVSQRALNSRLKSIQTQSTHSLQLSDLTSDTIYYVVFDITSNGLRIASSDIYTFRTAKTEANMPTIIPNTLVLLQDSSPIYGDAGDSIGPKIIVVADQIMDIHLSLEQASRIRHATLSLRRSDVLGLTDDATVEPDLALTSLTEIAPSKFVGRMRIPKEHGVYYLYMKIETKTGGMAETPIATVRLVSPLLVQTEGGKPIENAKITLKRYSEIARLYEPINPQSNAITSHLHSDELGRLPLNLSTGKYQLTIRAIGYEEKTIELDLRFEDASPYPTLKLTKIPFSLGLLTSYYRNITENLVSLATRVVGTVANSPRFWDLMLVILLMTTLFCAISSIALRLGIPLLELIPACIQHLRYMSVIHTHHIFHGTLRNERTHEAIAGARIMLASSDKLSVKSFTKTNILGEFALIVPKDQTHLCYRIEKKGYEAITKCSPSDFVSAHTLTLAPSPADHGVRISDVIEAITHLVLDFGLEFFITVALICELYLLMTNRFWIFAPFFGLTLLCIGTWIIWKRTWAIRMTHLQSW